LGWSAAWLYRATNDPKYKADVQKHWSEFKLGTRGQQFSWDDKKPGLQVLMAKLTKEEQYKKAAEDYVDWVVKVAPKSPKGKH
jgi:rhamnogalacturonyl hydrolase YesR